MGIINTNPVAKTSMDNGLSETGKKQTVRAALMLKEMGACDNGCWIWPSITQRAYQAAEIIVAVNGVNRSNIVPEYSFLDACGLGAYEGKALQSVSEIYASDGLSPNIRPPPINDGTPNESVADVFVRVTQLMSILETQYSEDTVIIVSPDSNNLTILQAGLLGLDLRSVILVRLWEYMLPTWLGIMPITFVFVYVGTTLKDLSDVTHGWHEISTTRWVGKFNPPPESVPTRLRSYMSETEKSEQGELYSDMVELLSLI